MRRKILVREAARSDLAEHAAIIAREDPVAAERFLQAAEQTFESLARMPHLGRRRGFSNPLLKGIRSWRIRGFPKILIFYKTVDAGIEVIRVLHGARDVELLFS